MKSICAAATLPALLAACKSAAGMACARELILEVRDRLQWITSNGVAKILK
ncbi:MAG: hypothetical protein VX951_09505 [Planctomycetota bacterium]|nr:hypothetical protein [Planctomycetota bacterium]